MSDQVDRWAATLNRPLSRRDLLKAGASSALLAMLGGDPPPASAASASPSRRSRRIVRAAIHPAIGIARVGNSPDEYYFGPEIPGGLPIAPGGYKDASGAMKRQAARFRIFGLDAQGRVVRELTAATRRSSGPCTSPTRRRPGTSSRPRSTSPRPSRPRGGTPRTGGSARDALVIDPGPRRVSGRNRGAVPFDTGTSWASPCTWASSAPTSKGACSSSAAGAARSLPTASRSRPSPTTTAGRTTRPTAR